MPSTKRFWAKTNITIIGSVARAVPAIRYGHWISAGFWAKIANPSWSGRIESEVVIREGKPAEEIHKLIEEDQDIAILVLAAGASKEGPGPLVASIAGKGAAFPIPVTVVPQNLSDEEIDSLA